MAIKVGDRVPDGTLTEFIEQDNAADGDLFGQPGPGDRAFSEEFFQSVVTEVRVVRSGIHARGFGQINGTAAAVAAAAADYQG